MTHIPNPRLIPTFLRELFAGRTLPREPEPALIMEDQNQVDAYVEAGRIDGIMAASYLFHSARVSQVIQGCRSVLDLGCGPATQLAQIAALNPDVQFTGVDLSPTMLSSAGQHIEQLGITNVTFREGDITTLVGIADKSVDAVISTMALHHLPTLQHLDSCFASISRILKPGGAIYLTDFGRLRSLKSVIFFAYMNAKHQPHLFSLDYERSLRAAFLREEFSNFAKRHFSDHVQIYSTFKVPFLVVIKTPDKPLPIELRSRLAAMRKSLHRRYIGDLDEMRLFLRLGGLPNDPFI